MPFSPLKDSNVAALPSRVRTLVIGGGIHGVGVAHDLASREWKDTLLLEKDEIGIGTSSSSTKLIHGGLRYLRRISQFSMVLKSLEERRALLRIAPDLVRPIELVYPIIKKGGLSSFMVRVGLFLYDLLSGRRSIKKHRKLDEKEVEDLVPGLKKDRFKSFYSFWDAQTDDLSLVIRVASSASKLGATIAEGIKVVGLEESEDGWNVTVEDVKGSTRVISCLYIVNCSGPWMNDLIKQCGLDPKVNAVNNRGTHIVIRDLGLSSGVFLESPDDGRIFFVLPWKGKTLIGTTEDIYEGDMDKQMPTNEDVNYLIDHFNKNFEIDISEHDIIAKFSGLRWLAVEEDENLSGTSREVVFSSHDSSRGFMLSLYGGKLTSYRALSEEIGDELTRHFGTIRRSRTSLKESWADVHEVVKQTQGVIERFKRFNQRV
jgi:glycerol-3-phosphate dehydrogenase